MKDAQEKSRCCNAIDVTRYDLVNFASGDTR